MEYVQYMPTGFCSNTYSVFLFACYFYLYEKFGKYRILVSLVVLFLLVAAGARLAILGFLLFQLTDLDLKNFVFFVRGGFVSSPRFHCTRDRESAGANNSNSVFVGRRQLI